MKACANLSHLFKENETFLSRYKAAANAGFRAVECDFPVDMKPEDLSSALEENQLTQVLINSFHGLDGQRGFAATPNSAKEFQESIKKTIPYLKATKCKMTHILSGKSLGPEKFSEQFCTLKENLLWVSKLFEEQNLIGLIEPINRHSVPGYFLSSYDTALQVLDEVNSPNIKLQLDLFHLQMIAGNVTNNIERLLPYTGHIQVAQSPHRHEPSSIGELNMEYVFKLLKDLGYDGYIGCEYVPSGSTVDSLNWIEPYGLSF